MNENCVFATLAEDPHTQGLFKASRIAQKVGINVEVLPPGTPDESIMRSIHRLDPLYAGFSYRMSPEIGVRELKRMLILMNKNGLLKRSNGSFRKIAFGGLIETIKAVEFSMSEFPCKVFTMPQDDDLLKRVDRVLEFFNTSDSKRTSILAELKVELFPPKIAELDELAKDIVKDDSYKLEPFLPIPSKPARTSFTNRIQESRFPVLRTHFGIPSDSIRPTVQGIRQLAECRVVDEISLGSSDLSQRYFGHPEEFLGRKNDGGVPYKSFDDLVKLVGAAQRGNFPSIKPYAHVVDLVSFVHTCIKSGMLIGAHQAVPLFWFNELDGRGPMTVPESIREHIAAVRELAKHGIPVEMNDPNQWSSRWAHDTIICADYGLITAVMLDSGVNDLVLQMQFNKPRETGDLADLAKMTAGLELANELLPPDRVGPRIWRETRTGIEYFDPDLELAKFQLARSTLLQMLVSPHIIHLVSYCEADHAATPEDIIDSSQLVRTCIRVFRQHEPDLRKRMSEPIVVERREFLLKEARFLLRRIAQLGRRVRDADKAPLRSLISRLASPDALIEALYRGYMAAPGIFHPDYSFARLFATGPTQNGFIDCLDPQTGSALTEESRLALIKSG